jgi:thiosulfate dehydrogenase [quinone] large subunit
MLQRLRARVVTGWSPRLPSDEAVAYALLRLTIGVTMLVHGANRIARGPEQFAAGMVRDFAATILPAFQVHLFGLSLPFIEAALGVLLILGLLTRWALVVGALLMIALVFGTTLREQFVTVGIQLIYAAIYFILIFNLRHNLLSLDHFLGRTSER